MKMQTTANYFLLSYKLFLNLLGVLKDFRLKILKAVDLD